MSSSKLTKPGVLVPPWRGVFTLSVAVFCIFTSFESLQNLQSSLHYKENLGPLALGLTYSTIVALSFFTAATVYSLGIKACLATSFVVHLLYVIANFYPTKAILLSASVVLGFGMVFISTTTGMYLTAVAHSYISLHELGPDKTHGIASMFNGIFFSFFKGTHVLGNLISSLVLSSSTYNMASAEHNVCGAAVCPYTSTPATNNSNNNDKYNNDDLGPLDNNNSSMVGKHASDSSRSGIVIVPPETHTLYILLTIYVIFDIIGLVVLLLFTPFFKVSHLAKTFTEQDIRSSTVLVQSDKDRGDEKTESCMSVFTANLRLSAQIFQDFRFWLLVPLYLGQAMVIMIMYTSYTQGFVSCAFGVQWVGYSMMCLGLSGALASVLFNFLAKHTGRIPLFTLCFLIDIGCLISMLLWQPDTDTPWWYQFILPTIAGISEGVFQPQQIALSSSLYGDKKATAFAVITATRSLAFTLTFITLSTICLYQQFTMASIVYSVGFIAYCAIEVVEYKKTIHRKKPSLDQELSPYGALQKS